MGRLGVIVQEFIRHAIMNYSKSIVIDPPAADNVSEKSVSVDLVGFSWAVMSKTKPAESDAMTIRRPNLDMSTLLI